VRWMAAALLAVVLGTTCAAAPKYGPQEVAELVEIARAEKEPEARRARAIRELEHTNVRTQASLLRRLLREERSLDIRLAAACTLAALGDGKSPLDLLLVTAYDGERTPNCSRTDVMLALGRTGSPAAEMHLEKALREEAPADEPYYYTDVCRALGLLGTPGSRKALLSALRDGAPAVRHAVVAPLSRIAVDARSPDRPEARQWMLLAARQDPDEKVAEQAASALLWSAVDGPGFFKLLEADPDPKVRARAARVMNRHYLSPSRLQRLRAALARETHPDVRIAMQETIRGQTGSRPTRTGGKQ
jgi:HEAT repeat protein